MATSSTRTKRWRLRHPERWKEFQRKYREKLRKPCRKCGAKIPYPSAGRKYCDKCVPIVKKETGVKFRQKRLQSLAQYKLNTGCSKCGYRKCASALHFHHLKPIVKEHRVWIPKGKEFNKCILLCANCHFEIHER